MRFLKWLWKLGAGAWGLYEALSPFLTVGTIVGVGVMLSAAWDWPVPHIYLAAIFLFAAGSHGLLRFDEWRERRRVPSKLVFGGIAVYADKTGDGRNLERVQLAIILTNRAFFPISYRIDALQSSAMRTLPQTGPTLIGRTQVLQPNTTEHFKDHIVILPSPAASVEGEVRFEISYGHPGSEDSQLKKAVGVSIRLDPTKGEINSNWVYLTS